MRQCSVHSCLVLGTLRNIMIKSTTLRCQINESTRLAFSYFFPSFFYPTRLAFLHFFTTPHANFFHPTWLANFPPYLFIRHCFSRISLITAYSFIKCTQNTRPTRLFGPTCLIGTWEYDYSKIMLAKLHTKCIFYDFFVSSTSYRPTDSFLLQ